MRTSAAKLLLSAWPLHPGQHALASLATTTSTSLLQGLTTCSSLHLTTSDHQEAPTHYPATTHSQHSPAAISGRDRSHGARQPLPVAWIGGRMRQHPGVLVQGGAASVQPWCITHACGLSTQQRPNTDDSPEHTPSQQASPQAGSAPQVVDSLWTPPNMLSLARAASGPFIAYLILEGNWPWAITATAISGLTDWADGALARHLGQSSVLGSYLDPLADKVLVACVVGALAVQGLAPTWLAVLVVGRDVGLVTGMALHRWRALGWRLKGVTASEFFSTAEVPLMKPLFISKVNTVLQLMLVCGCMTHAWVDLPGADLLHQLEVVTAVTTAASLGAYMWAYASGRLLPLPVSGKL